MRLSCWLIPWALCAGLMGLAMPAIAAACLDQPVLPPGFHVALYSEQVPKARQIALDAKGTVFVSSDEGGKAYALTGNKRDGAAERVRVLAIGVPSPVAGGVAFRHGDLYVPALNKIVALRGIEDHLDDPPTPQLITGRLPDGLAHGAKFFAFGPDGKLYVAIGAPRNICKPDQGHAKLIRMNEDGSGWRDVARSV